MTMIAEMIRFAERRLERLQQQRSETIDLEVASNLDAEIVEVQSALTKLRSLL
jgi:hypothetical protein